MFDSTKKDSCTLHIQSCARWPDATIPQCHPEHAFKFAFGTYHPAAQRAFEIQQARAIAQGQSWSPEHAAAFRELHQAYVLTGLGIHRGRTAWPLAVGTGKTQSLVAFALAQTEVVAQGGSPLSLLICIERVDHIRDMVNELVAAGVPRELIGSYHRKTEREIREEGLLPATPVEDLDRYPFLVATHAMMLKGDDSIDLVNTYRGKPRHLVVWDESLIKSQGRHFDLADIEGALGVLQAVVRDTVDAGTADARDAAEFIAQCTAVLREDFELSKAGAEPRTVELPRLTPEDETRFLVGIVEALKGNDDVRKGSRRRLTGFIEHVQRPVRVVPYLERGRRIGVVHYLTRIPESLSRLIVLDASHTIRLLTSEHDSSLRETLVDCKIKSFSTVTVRQLVQGAGREKLDKELPKASSSTIKKLVDTVKGYPADEAVIVITFKPDRREERLGRSHAEHLKRHFKKAEVDIDAKLSDGRPRFIWLTWGQHIGISDYAYAQHVLCVGVLRRDVLDVASQIVGQRADLLAPQAADPAEVHRAVLSEMFHNVVQAAGRGSCRTTRDGFALPMTLTLLCSETFPGEWWQAAMPGVVVDALRPGERETTQREREQDTAVVRALEELPKEQQRIAKRTLKVAAGLTQMSPPAYSRLLARVLGRGIDGWADEGRSLVRAGDSVDSGEVPQFADETLEVA